MALSFPSKVKGQLTQFQGLMNTVQNEVKVDQGAQLSLTTSATPAQFFERDGEGIFKLLLKGIQVKGQVQLWKSLSKIFMQILSKDLDQVPLPVIGVVAPALLLSLNGNIAINCDEEQ